MMSNNNSLTNIRNVLGFLLAGFGAFLSFLGIQSSEVTTILRNDSPQASLVALLLLLGVLAAVLAIAIDSAQTTSLMSAAAVAAIIFGIGSLVIFLVPIGRNLFTVSGTISLLIGCILVLAGAVVLILPDRFWAVQDSGLPSTAPTGSGSGRPKWRLWLSPAKQRRVERIDVLIIASVLLTAIAAYGAIRLESKSQLSFSSQVGASFSVEGPIAKVSVDIAATRLPQSDWIFVYVYAVPARAGLSGMCAKYAPNAIPHCETDPCIFFGGRPDICNVLLNGSIVPNSAGNVDETLDVPFVIAKYQDVDVRAEVCSPNPREGCQGSASGQNSRLDWVISRSMPK